MRDHIVLYMLQDKCRIKKHCNITIELKTILPAVKYLTNVHWIVYTQANLVVVKICVKGQDIINSGFIVKPPFQIVAPKESCSAVTSELTVPPHYHQESKYNMTNILRIFMTSHNVSLFKLWKPIHSTKIINCSAI